MAMVERSSQLTTPAATVPVNAAAAGCQALYRAKAGGRNRVEIAVVAKGSANGGSAQRPGRPATGADCGDA
jgi:hypothetical protein